MKKLFFAIDRNGGAWSFSAHVNQDNGVSYLPFAGIIEYDPKQLEVAASAQPPVNSCVLT